MFSLAFGRSGQVGRGLLKPPVPSPPPFSRRVHQRNGVCPAVSVCRILLTLSLWYPFACSSAPRISRELVGFPRSVRSHENFLFQSPVSPPQGAEPQYHRRLWSPVAGEPSGVVSRVASACTFPGGRWEGRGPTCQAAAPTEMDVVLAPEGHIVSWGGGSSR